MVINVSTTWCRINHTIHTICYTENYEFVKNYIIVVNFHIELNKYFILQMNKAFNYFKSIRHSQSLNFFQFRFL